MSNESLPVNGFTEGQEEGNAAETLRQAMLRELGDTFRQEFPELAETSAYQAYPFLPPKLVGSYSSPEGEVAVHSLYTHTNSTWELSISSAEGDVTINYLYDQDRGYVSINSAEELTVVGQALARII